jgi:hypothetical protein
MDNHFEKSKAVYPVLSITENLADALFIEYGKDNDKERKVKVMHLADDMIAIIKDNKDMSEEDLLAKVKDSSGYLKLSADVIFEDNDIMGFLENIKYQLEKNN